MLVMSHKLPVLFLAVSRAGEIEREINRDILINVAPEREEFLRIASIDEIRGTLKLPTDITSRHWLYRTAKKKDFKEKERSTRYSSYSPPLFPRRKVNENTGVNDAETRFPARQRALSTSAITKTVPNRIARHLSRPSALNTSIGILDKPTHVLIVYATQASKNSLTFHQKRDPLNTFRDSRRSTMIAPTYPEVVEILINDLLFLLNVPNLMVPDVSSGDLAVLPRRLHQEMPRVMLRVPRLETFPELVVYLHTKDMAALFNRLIPQWIRNAIHPLPNALPSSTSPASGVRDPLKNDTAWNFKKFLGKLVPDSLPFSNCIGVHPIRVKTLSCLAFELALLASRLDGELGEEELVLAAAGLDALSNNLEFIGYYDKDIWNELRSYQSILLQAISHSANVNVIAPN